MKTIIKNEITVVLKLDESEAKWLKAIMQNAFVDKETKTDSEMRMKFWDALKEIKLN